MGPEQTLEAFEAELVAWLDASDAPPVEDSVAWSERLGQAGLLAPDWVPEHGGLGLPRTHVRALESALRERGIRRTVSGGLEMLAPALLEYASPEQLLEFLPPIARAETMWAQGYSEPQAGSDLANVQMRCEDQGDHYLVNGQKIWTSGADQSDWIFCLVRTDPSAKKHDGISFLLVDLRSEGISISPIVLISGRSPFCEVFFSDVRVPKGNLIGGEGGGWPIAKRLLQFERNMLGSGGLASLTGKAGRKSLADVARERVGVDAEGRLQDAGLRERVARQWVDEQANRLTGRRGRGGDAARVSSILKLASSETSQQRYALLMDLLGSEGFGWESEGFSAHELSIPRQWLRSRANTIEGGTSEVQLNIIAKRVLGMTGGGSGVPDQSLARNEDEALIRDSALQFLTEQDPLGSVRDWRDAESAAPCSAAFWSAVQELGWPGLLAPEDQGGAGLGLRECAVVFEALGRHAVSTPLFASGVLATSALTLLDAWGVLPKAETLVTGDGTVALALDESARFDPSAIATTARRVDGGFELSGTKRPVLDGAAAERWLVWARLEAPENADTPFALFVVDPSAAGVHCETLRWIDGRRAAAIRFDAVRLDASALLGTPCAEATLVEPLLDRASVILAAELCGIAAAALKRTVEYLVTREQFDQRLAEFQALQHRCARLFADIERTISITQAAAAAVDEGASDASALASGAKALASEVARTTTEEALQLHGGLGMTEEQDIGLFFKRARTTSAIWGDARYHLARVATQNGY
ncbi:MAG: acyl-CoA dehydrogenase family protein [Myxococcota bacterium]